MALNFPDEVEVIPISNEQARRKDPIHIQLNRLESWPDGGTFQIRMDWNSAIEKWVFEAERDDYGLLFPRTVAHIDRVMTHKRYLLMMFSDRSNDATQVRPRNLGAGVKLICLPGPESSAFPVEEEETAPPWSSTGRYG